MDYQRMIENMSPEIYRSLKRAVEIGKWPDGQPVTSEQRANAMQAIIAWGRQHLPQEEQVGYIDKGHKEGDSCDDPAETTLKWQQESPRE